MLFALLCKDKPGHLNVRLETRPTHLAYLDKLNAEGVAIAEDFVVDQVEKTRPMGPYKPSTMLDYLAGKPLELEPIWGEPLRRARRLGVAAPELDRLYAGLQARAACRAGGE